MNESAIERINFYAIKDVAMSFFAPPFLARSDGEAKSLIRNSIEPGSILSRFPADYHLYRVGGMNSQTGIDDCESVCIASVTDIIRSMEVSKDE